MTENKYGLKGLVALVIENEGSIERSIQGLIKDNPDLFAHVHKVTYAADRPEQVIETLEKEPIDCILICSTFRDKHQLEDLAYHLAESGKPYIFILHYAEQKLNEWLTEPNYACNFSERQKFIALCKILVGAGLVYEYGTATRSKEIIHDNLHGLYGVWDAQDRTPYILERMCYSAEHDIFYTDGETEQDIINKLKWIKR